MATFHCPICRRDFDNLNLFAAEAHLWFHHFRRDRDRNATCRCGKSLGDPRGETTLIEIMAHIEAEGGVEAHYLACELGEANAR